MWVWVCCNIRDGEIIYYKCIYKVYKWKCDGGKYIVG